MNLNLFTAANAAIVAVNENTTGTVWASTGATTGASGHRMATFESFPGVPLQVQAMSAENLRHVDGLNLQSVMRSVHFNGFIDGLDRPAGRGGDVLAFDGTWWLVTQVLETWDRSGWVHVAVTLQNGKPAGIP